MKRLIIVFTFFYISAIGIIAQPVANELLPKVDKRVELLSIIFKLANQENLADTLNPMYSKAIDHHFKGFSNHPLINHLRTIMDSLKKVGIEDISSWEIPAIAVHIGQPPNFEPLVSYLDVSNADNWEDRTLFKPKFVTLLKQFYKESSGEAFFKTQESYYDLVNQGYPKQGIKINKDWLKRFFGIKATENYYAIIGLQHRFGTYTRVNFKNNYRNSYTVFACTEFDKKGIPTTFTKEFFPRLLLHEYIHAFTNQLVDKNITTLQKPAEIILSNPKVWEKVKETFYNNWQFILYESMVRACSIQYLATNNELKTTLEKEIAVQEKAGFFWIRGFVEKLNFYEKNRKTYKNLETFMPEINQYLIKVAEEMEKGIFVFPKE